MPFLVITFIFEQNSCPRKAYIKMFLVHLQFCTFRSFNQDYFLKKFILKKTKEY